MMWWRRTGRWAWGGARRVVIATIGAAIVVLGIVLLPLPGPGSLVILVGLSVLATEFEVARRVRNRMRAKAREAYRQLRGRMRAEDRVGRGGAVPPAHRGSDEDAGAA